MATTSRSPARAAPPKNTAPPWTLSLEQSAAMLEREIESVVREHPLAVVGGALAVGFLGFLAVKNRKRAAPPASRKRGTSKKSVLKDVLKPSLQSFYEGFERLPAAGVSEIGKSLKNLITDELNERPFQTLGSTVVIGYGLGNMDGEQLKQSAIRLAKRWALNAIEGEGPDSNFNPNANPTPIEGDIDEREHESNVH